MASGVPASPPREGTPSHRASWRRALLSTLGMSPDTGCLPHGLPGVRMRGHLAPLVPTHPPQCPQKPPLLLQQGKWARAGRTPTRKPAPPPPPCLRRGLGSGGGHAYTSPQELGRSQSSSLLGPGRKTAAGKSLCGNTGSGAILESGGSPSESRPTPSRAHLGESMTPPSRISCASARARGVRRSNRVSAARTQPHTRAVH